MVLEETAEGGGLNGGREPPVGEGESPHLKSGLTGRRARRFSAKKPGFLALLCDLKQAASLLWASVSPQIKQ